MSEETAARVVCQDCWFSTVVRPDDDRLPADVVIDHGKESGHKLSVESLEVECP